MEENEIVTSMLFKKALETLINNNEGIIIEVENNIKPFFPGKDKIIVAKIYNTIKILDYDGELLNGSLIDIVIE